MAAGAVVRDFARFVRTVYKQIFNAPLQSVPSLPSLGRVLFSARVLQLYSIYSKSNGFFLPALTSFSSFSILFYFISTVCIFLSVCVCVCAVIESHFNGRRFSRQFSLCCSWGQFWGQQLAQLAHWMFLLRQMNGNCPGLAVVVPLPLSLSPRLSLPPFCHKIISLVKIFHSHLCFYFAALAFGL